MCHALQINSVKCAIFTIGILSETNLEGEWYIFVVLLYLSIAQSLNNGYICSLSMKFTRCMDFFHTFQAGINDLDKIICNGWDGEGGGRLIGIAQNL